MKLSDLQAKFAELQLQGNPEVLMRVDCNNEPGPFDESTHTAHIYDLVYDTERERIILE